jgi:hypothetical protein
MLTTRNEKRIYTQPAGQHCTDVGKIEGSLRRLNAEMKHGPMHFIGRYANV